MTTPLRDRFGIPLRLEFYNHDELIKIVSRGAGLLDLDLAPDGAAEIARRSRGTPRVAARLLRRVRDFATVDQLDIVDAAWAKMCERHTRAEQIIVCLPANDELSIRFVVNPDRRTYYCYFVL